MTEKTQKTPKGTEIPIPTKKEFLDNLKNVSEPKEPDPDKSESGAKK